MKLAEQLSVALAPFVKSGTNNSQALFNTIVCGPSQIGVGGVASSPVNNTEQDDEFPFPSYAVTVIVCVVPSPDANNVPAFVL